MVLLCVLLVLNTECCQRGSKNSVKAATFTIVHSHTVARGSAVG